jgi:hypothetical protein
MPAVSGINGSAHAPAAGQPASTAPPPDKKQEEKLPDPVNILKGIFGR